MVLTSDRVAKCEIFVTGDFYNVQKTYNAAAAVAVAEEELKYECYYC